MSDAAEKRLSQLSERFSLDPLTRIRLLRLAEWSLEVEISGTAIEGRQSAVDRHIADSLVAVDLDEIRAAGRIVDIGSGLGFPGLALAAVLGAQVVLVDSVRKKMEAAARIAAELELDNVECVWGRAEELAESGSPHREAYDVVTARALADLAVLVEYASPLLRTGGHLVAWKGSPEQSEIESADSAAPHCSMAAPRRIAVNPFPGSERALYMAEKTGPTPANLPRRPGMALKKPLA